MAARPVFGAIEGGGTKFVAMIGTGPDDIVDEITVPTGEPSETLGSLIEFFLEPRADVALAAVGVSTFGPIDLRPGSPNFGSTMATTKPRWSNVRIVAPLARRLGVPIGFDTDVNGAVLGEARWGAAQGFDPALYLTVGTGVGGGAIVNGKTIHGLLHPELGHIPMPRLPGDDYPGYCTFHGRCLEGLVCGPALADRAGRPLAELSETDPIWDLAARYLAYGLSAFVVTLSPQRIVLGGGVMHQAHLLPRIRRALLEVLNGYVQVPVLTTGVDEYVVLSPLDHRAGLYGALVLAERALAASPGGHEHAIV
jgi:fructokinase